MKARWLWVAMLSVALVVPFAVTAADAEKSEFKALCPMSGKAAKEASNLEFYGKRVYFCCDNCPKGFQAKIDKAKESDEGYDEALMAKVAQQMVQTGQIVQVGCPFSGRAVNADTIVDVKGAKVGFCCNNCKGKFAKTAEGEQLALVFNKDSLEGCEKGQASFTLQTRCPMSGKPISADVFAEVGERKVFFCCAGCKEPFSKEPSKFEAALKATMLTFKDGSCCSKAIAGGKACSHPCCAEAIADGSVCGKCNKF